MSKTDKLDNSITSNIHDLALGHNIAARIADPYVPILAGITALTVCVKITFAIKERMRVFMLLQDKRFYEV